MEIELDTQTESTLKRDILEAIDYYGNITQKSLAAIYGIPQRHIRAIVQELKSEGNLIKGDDNGYHIATSLEEFESEIAEHFRSLRLIRDMKRRYLEKRELNLFEK